MLRSSFGFQCLGFRFRGTLRNVLDEGKLTCNRSQQKAKPKRDKLQILPTTLNHPLQSMCLHIEVNLWCSPERISAPSASLPRKLLLVILVVLLEARAAATPCNTLYCVDTSPSLSSSKTPHLPLDSKQKPRNPLQKARTLQTTPCPGTRINLRSIVAEPSYIEPSSNLENTKQP